MEVIFLKDLLPTGNRGEIKLVNDGYARNFLIPKKYASPVTPQLKSKFLEEKKRLDRISQEKQKNEENLLEKLHGLTLNFTEKSNEVGTLFSGVNKDKIIAEINKSIAITINPDDVILEKTIKQIGEYTVNISLKGKLIPINIKITNEKP